jgi:ornithine carbamoyltransferase
LLSEKTNMAVSLSGRNLVSLKDFSTEEVLQIIHTADTLKLERLRGQAHPLLAGKTLAMIFQKPSLRTRVSFEAGMTQLGGHAIYLAPTDISIGKRETTEDIALVVSRYCDSDHGPHLRPRHRGRSRPARHRAGDQRPQR